MSGGDDQRIRIILDELAQVAGLPPPPPIPPAQMASLGSAIDELLAVLTAAGGLGIPVDNADAQQGQAEREAKINEALAKFPANEQQSATRLAGIDPQGQLSQMTQQLPQLASGMAGAVSGALGGALQPLSQIPQQFSQIGQQAMQMGMGALQHGAGSDLSAAEDLPGELAETSNQFGSGGLSGAPEMAGSGSGSGDGIWGGTTPTAMLGPPPVPSAGTFPASSQTTPSAPVAPPEQSPGARGNMGPMPLMPPTAMHGNGAAGAETKPDAKRVVPPPVRNGAQVQGRITTPPPVPAVTKHIAGKPVTTRRILLPDRKNDDADSGLDN
ncbi:MAG: hypothetical protein K2Q25_04575 [Mycobacteriaceae bacterium]|nr:hypothetical protein [Mycobacteriaceae bacterium]